MSSYYLLLEQEKEEENKMSCMKVGASFDRVPWGISLYIVHALIFLIYALADTSDKISKGLGIALVVISILVLFFAVWMSSRLLMWSSSEFSKWSSNSYYNTYVVIDRFVLFTGAFVGIGLGIFLIDASQWDNILSSGNDATIYYWWLQFIATTTSVLGTTGNVRMVPAGIYAFIWRAFNGIFSFYYLFAIATIINKLYSSSKIYGSNKY